MREKLKDISAAKIKLEIELFIKHSKYDDKDGYEFNLPDIIDFIQKQLRKLDNKPLTFKNKPVQYLKNNFYFPIEPKKIL